MARDSSGNYSLPAGTIVSSGDTILPSQHNPAMNDLASSMTNSLARSGVGGMLADLNLGGFSLVNAFNIASSQAAIGGNLTVGGSSTVAGVARAGAFTTVGGLTVNGASDLNTFTSASGSVSGVLTTGAVVTGGLTVTGGSSFSGNITAPAFISGAAAYFGSSGGVTTVQFANGWTIVNNPGTGKIGIYIANVLVFSVDGSGNVRAAGNVTGNITP